MGARTARRIAAAAAFGGGGLTVIGGLTFGLVVVEAQLARRIIKSVPSANPPDAEGLYGKEFASGASPELISFVLLGDSTAAGVGADEPDETPGGLLAAGLSASAMRPVQLISVAFSGARSADLADQVTKALEAGPEVAVIMIGANDVTGRVKPAESVRYLDAAVRRLREAGCQVVVGTCPDLGSVEPVMHPLRWLARRASRQLAAAQTIAVVEAGGRTVSLGNLLAAEFKAAPREMFSTDRYHPSARGYAAAAVAVLPSMVAALELESESDIQFDTNGGNGVLPVYLAAAEAAEEPGTEVSGASVAGKERGPRGRWAALLRRRSASDTPGGSQPTAMAEV